MIKYAKYMKNISIQNSNNINVRKNYGSNDSHVAAAPHQKKYQVTNKFNLSKSKEKQKMNCIQRKGSMQKQQQCASIISQIQSNIQNPLVGTFANNVAESSGSENVSISVTNSGADMGSFSLQQHMPLRDITKQVVKMKDIENMIP